MFNSQEKLYIDIDEEITTVIDRLRKISAQLVYVVVPQRALLLQSIVNLKLLERESRKQKKKIVIMTKDEEGIVFASRAGIEVQPFIGNEDAFETAISPNQNYFSNNTYKNNFSQTNNLSNSDSFYQSKSPNLNPNNLNQEYDRFNVSQRIVHQKNTASNFVNQVSVVDSNLNYPINRANNQNFNDNYFNEKNQKATMDMQVKRRVVASNDTRRNNFQNPNFSNPNFSQDNFSDEVESQRDSYLEYLSRQNLNQDQQDDSQNPQNFSANFYSKNSGGHQMVDENFYQFEQNNPNYLRQNYQNSNFSNSTSNSKIGKQIDQNLSRNYTQNYNNQIPSSQNPSFYGGRTNSLNLINSQSLNQNSFSKERNQDFLESSGAEVSYLSRKKPKEISKSSSKSALFGSNKDTNNSLHKTIDKKNHVKSSSVFSKIVFFFIFFAVVLGGLYFVFPKTDLKVKIKEVNIEENITFTAKVDQPKTDLERMIIPSRQIKKEVVYSRTINSTGKADVESQKAQGIVTINNEFEDKEIPLVKTTRFTSENGVLFHLAEDVKVPKAKMENGKKVNGTIKALLVADQSGEKGNVKSPTFFINAFEGMDKYKKVYAKSDSEMKGGGAGGKGMPVVTEDDIKNAKDNMEKSLEAFVRDDLASLVRSDEVMVFINKDSVDIKITNSGSKVAVNTAVKEFDYEITADVTAFVFPQKSVNELAMEVIKKKDKAVSLEKLEIKYNSAKAEFDSGNLKVEAKAVVKYKPDFDVAQFKKDILGKKYSDVENIIKENYKQIEGNIESISFPSFFSDRISRFEKMTKVVVE